MPTLTIAYRDDAERLALEQVIAYVAQLRQVAQDAPDGSVLTKCDAGGYAGMADSGDDDKSGYSDAFKRAAVKFGVARYRYRDGAPTFVLERHGRIVVASPCSGHGFKFAPVVGRRIVELSTTASG